MRPVSAPAAGMPGRASNSLAGRNDAAPAIASHCKTSRREAAGGGSRLLSRSCGSAHIVTYLPSEP